MTLKRVGQLCIPAVDYLHDRGWQEYYVRPLKGQSLFCHHLYRLWVQMLDVQTMGFWHLLCETLVVDIPIAIIDVRSRDLDLRKEN